jgi:hypothetical protein
MRLKISGTFCELRSGLLPALPSVSMTLEFHVPRKILFCILFPDMYPNRELHPLIFINLAGIEEKLELCGSRIVSWQDDPVVFDG